MFSCGYNYSLQLFKESNNRKPEGYPFVSPPLKYHSDMSSYTCFSTNWDQTVCITNDGESYITGFNCDGLLCGSLPKEVLAEDTKFVLKDDHDNPYKFHLAVSGVDFTLYVVSNKTNSSFKLVYCYREEEKLNPLFLSIENIIPKAIYCGHNTAGLIDNEGGIIVITNSVLKYPTDKIETTFLPFNEKAVKLALCESFVISLSQTGRVYKSEIQEKKPLNFSEVTEFSDKTVIDVSGNSHHCFVILKDGRIFGYGSNYSCCLGFSDKTDSVDSFTEIESLKDYKIVAAFAGYNHSIFKTSESKMIICGSNKYGNLFIPPKEFVFPPEEVSQYQGFKFCITGIYVSTVFMDIDPPPKIGNRKTISTESLLIFAEAAKEIVILKKKLIEKEKEISSLKKESLTKTAEIKKKDEMTNDLKKKDAEILSLKKQNMKLKSQIKKLNCKLDEKKINPMKIYTTDEIEDLGEGKLIGKGATSEVFQVFRKEKIAKKVLNLTEEIESNSDNDDDNQEPKVSIEQLRRLIRECEVLNSLDHPNIIKVYGFYFGDSTHFPAILLEHCQSNLKKRIKKLTDKERISAIIGLSSAMKMVHSVGIIHRDLKMENILLDSENNVKLSDFGLCTFIKTDDQSASRTQMAGTLKFMAPELLQGRTDYDEKVDVYAFGIVVFLILTKGKYPEISIADVVGGKKAKIPSEITEFSSKLIQDCWSFNSKDRPSFEEICNRLNGKEQNLI